MKKILILVVLAGVLVPDAQACFRKKRKKKAVVTQHQVSDTLKNVLVSFVSHGSGIDFKSVPVFEKMFSDFNQRYAQCKLEFIKKNWGREGEVDYCIQVRTGQCLNEFLVQLQSQFKGNDRVLIRPNGKCKS